MPHVVLPFKVKRNKTAGYQWLFISTTVNGQNEIHFLTLNIGTESKVTFGLFIRYFKNHNCLYLQSSDTTDCYCEHVFVRVMLPSGF